MNCFDLMNIPTIKNGMKLLAGNNGTHRHIRWIYFADCAIEFTDKYNLSDFIYGEELVIITNKQLTDNVSKLIKIIDDMFKKNVAGLVIEKGNISDDIITYCNDHDLPLFELSLELHLVDFSHIVCHALIEEESTSASRERFLSSILYSNELSSDDILMQCDYLDIDMSAKYFAIIYQISDSINKTSFKNNSEKHTLHITDTLSLELRDKAQKIIYNEFRSFGIKHPLTLWQVNKSIVMLKADTFDKHKLIEICQNIIQHVKNTLNITLKAGIGTPYEYINDFKKSYREAKNALTIFDNIDKNHDIFFYNELGIYSIIAQINNEKFLNDYVETKLGSLIKADTVHDGSLLQTLETYLDNNCKQDATAEAMFIHKNTLRYRLDKIKKILNTDLNDLSDYMELKFAFAIMHITSVPSNT